MSDDQLWNSFYQTGKVSDYLAYAASSKNGECAAKDEVEYPGHYYSGNPGGGK